MEAADGLQAVTAAQRHSPDLLILDYRLPAGSGSKALECIRQDRNLTDIPAINERPAEAIGIKQNGSQFPVELIGKEIPYESRKVNIIVIRDITERKRAEQERAELLLREQEARKEAETANRI